MQVGGATHARSASAAADMHLWSTYKPSAPRAHQVVLGGASYTHGLYTQCPSASVYPHLPPTTNKDESCVEHAFARVQQCVPGLTGLAHYHLLPHAQRASAQPRQQGKAATSTARKRAATGKLRRQRATHVQEHSRRLDEPFNIMHSPHSTSACSLYRRVP